MPSDQTFLLGASAAGSFGAGIGRTAIPLLAVGTLGATPFEVGVLTAAQTAAFMVLGLPAGAIVDRLRKRQTMIAMDLVRLGLGVALVLLWWAGLLGMGALIALVAAMGCATVLFDVAAMAYLSQLAGPDRLRVANGRLQGISSATSVGAPAAAGGLVAVVGAATTTVGIALGYAVSAMVLGRVRHREPRVEPRSWWGVWRETGAGLRLVFETAALRVVAVCTIGINLAHAARAAILVIFLLQLDLSPAEIGVATAASGVGGVFAAAGARSADLRRIWRMLLVTQMLAALVPLAGGRYALGMVCAGMAVSSCGATRYNIAQLTFRQLSCPPGLLGRVTASNRFLVWAMLPIGGLLGGVLAGYLPVVGVLWLATAAQVASALWLTRFRPSGWDAGND